MHKLPKGKYFIGDPSVVFSSEKWAKISEACEHFQDDEIKTFEGLEFWVFTTGSDGIFCDQNGNEYEVDSGLLGAIPVELIEIPEGEEHGTMLEVTSDRGFNVEYLKGAFYFGNICINTGEDEDEDYDEDDPYSGDPEDDYFV